ncbi:MAG: HPr kinase/phosphorylase, partial [Acholeplasmataceae bacterium]|nr:HPr kinase/phosphorylase [Acholeplasmataceae bacterium]
MKLKIKHLIRDLQLELLSDIKHLQREVKSEMLSRPGVELAGFLDFFDADRLILIGSKEAQFLDKLPYDIRKERVEDMLMKTPPGIVFSVNVNIEEFFIELGNQYGVAILRSQSRTTPLSGSLYQYLHSKLAPRTSMHGVLLDIHGLGTL